MAMPQQEGLLSRKTRKTFRQRNLILPQEDKTVWFSLHNPERNWERRGKTLQSDWVNCQSASSRWTNQIYEFETFLNTTAQGHILF